MRWQNKPPKDKDFKVRRTPTTTHTAQNARPPDSRSPCSTDLLPGSQDDRDAMSVPDLMPPAHPSVPLGTLSRRPPLVPPPPALSLSSLSFSLPDTLNLWSETGSSRDLQKHLCRLVPKAAVLTGTSTLNSWPRSPPPGTETGTMLRLSQMS